MWRERLASRFAARDAVERAPFERVFAAYAKLLRRSDFQSDAIERLRSEATLLRHGGGTGSTAATGGSSGADTSQLEARVRELQDELSAKYKTESAAAHAQLALQSEAKEWRRKYEEADAALAALRTVEAEAQRALVARERETAEAREARDAASAQMLTLHKSASELTVENERLARDLRDRRTQWTRQSAFDLLDRECKGARVAFVRVRGGSVVWAAAADRATRTFCTNLPPPSHTRPHRRSDERRGGAIVRALR
jgi:chromosome segregation ATPase